jgi:hypothetical protein
VGLAHTRLNRDLEQRWTAWPGLSMHIGAAAVLAGPADAASVISRACRANQGLWRCTNCAPAARRRLSRSRSLGRPRLVTSLGLV